MALTLILVSVMPMSHQANAQRHAYVTSSQCSAACQCHIKPMLSGMSGYAPTHPLTLFSSFFLQPFHRSDMMSEQMDLRIEAKNLRQFTHNFKSYDNGRIAFPRPGSPPHSLARACECNIS
jgi:hypothetical protein